jgi:hypothetical protein
MFKCFLSERGDDLIDEWYEEIGPKAQAKLDAILEHFRDTPNHMWGKKHFKQLVGYDGIYEIRFSVNNVVYRPLGFFGPERNEFTFLIGAREQGDEFIPRGAPNIAEQRKSIVLKERGRCHECDF